MATFPLLKTGAIAQYPFVSSRRFTTQEIRFLDGSRQTYQLQTESLGRWVIRLDLLDDSEVAAIEQFADAQQGYPFAFVDPTSGATVQKCIIQENAVETTALRELNSKVKLTIQEVR